ncbi:MAG TPA: ABC transporter permease subunit, partial [Dehalococcoidia bacterium]|nr:ABC transporter permease subunit [Dehalococcoidia bacterium]
MLDAVRSDIFRQRKRLMPTVLLVIFALIACALYVVPWIAEKAQGDEMNLRDLLDLRASLWIQNVIPYGLQFQSFFGLVLTAVLAGSSVGGEFSSGTVRTIIIRTRARWHFVAAKLTTIALFALLLPTLGMTLHLALAAAMTRDVGGNFDDVFTFAYAGDLATAVLRAFWCLLTYATLVVLLGVWTRSTAVAIAGSIGALFLEP